MTSKLTAAAFAAVLASATAAVAASDDFTKVDADKNGMVTFEEGKKMHADWTDQAFKALDLDGDGSLNVEEYTAAVTGSQPAGAETNSTTSTETAATMKDKGKFGPATYIDAAGDADVMASTLIGMRVYAVEQDIDETRSYPAESRKDWNDIGEVNDVVLDWNGGTKAVVLGIGGFLGIGEKDVAVDMASLRKVREADDAGDWFLVVNASKATLESAPTYKRMTN